MYINYSVPPDAERLGRASGYDLRVAGRAVAGIQGLGFTRLLSLLLLPLLLLLLQLLLLLLLLFTLQ